MRYAPRSEGRGFDGVHFFLPLLAQLFLLCFESACVPNDWKIAKVTPLYKKGPMLDPNSSHARGQWHHVQSVCIYRSLPTHSLV